MKTNNLQKLIHILLEEEIAKTASPNLKKDVKKNISVGKKSGFKYNPAPTELFEDEELVGTSDYFEDENDEVEEMANAIATGNVVGYQAPLGTPTDAIHKAFFPDAKKNGKPKTGSPDLDKSLKEIKIEKLENNQYMVDHPDRGKKYGNTKYIYDVLTWTFDDHYMMDWEDNLTDVVRIEVMGFGFREKDWDEKTQSPKVSVSNEQPLDSGVLIYYPKTNNFEIEHWEPGNKPPLHTMMTLQQAIPESFKMELKRLGIALKEDDSADSEFVGDNDFTTGDDFTKVGEGVLDQMSGIKHVGNTRMPYGQTYQQNDTKRDNKVIKQVNKNLNRKAMSLHNPPEMGISITRKSLKDRK